MAVALARPQGDDREPERDPAYAGDWYDERRDEQTPHADLYLPLFQGDVFFGVPLSGVPFTDVPQDGLPGDAVRLSEVVMLVDHPCSMVDGAVVLPYVEAVRVRATTPAHYDQYDKGRYDEFFLPFLDPLNPAVHYSACLRERRLILTTDLDLRKRVAVLSRNGVIALQQRMTHASTRVVASEADLLRATGPRYLENQLARQWNVTVLEKLELEDDDLLVALDEEARAYDAALGAEVKAADADSGYVVRSTLRREMFDPRNESRVTVAVTKLSKLRKRELLDKRNQAKQRAQQAAKNAAPEEVAAQEVQTEAADARPIAADQPTTAEDLAGGASGG